MNSKSLYSQSGVDISLADKAKAKMRQLVEQTFDRSVIGSFGGFGGLYSLKELTGRDLVLVGSADGVGTKLKLAFASGRHATIGQDLVNHLVNDILCCGARPLFLFDYLGLGKINQDVVLDIIRGLSLACRENGVALLGGETAQMPGFYAEGEYDIAGFIVGYVEKDKIIDGGKIKPGDKIIGLASNGLHTNGYSLARKAFFDIAKMNRGEIIPETSTEVYRELLRVHCSYLHAVRPLLDAGLVKGIAHITGGGFKGNISRILPAGVTAVIKTDSWPAPGLFKAIQRIADVPKDEMYQVFNMGIGLVLMCDEKDADEMKSMLGSVQHFEIGFCQAGQREVKLIF